MASTAGRRGSTNLRSNRHGPLIGFAGAAVAPLVKCAGLTISPMRWIRLFEARSSSGRLPSRGRAPWPVSGWALDGASAPERHASELPGVLLGPARFCPEFTQRSNGLHTRVPFWFRQESELSVLLSPRTALHVHAGRYVQRERPASTIPARVRRLRPEATARRPWHRAVNWLLARLHGPWAT